MKSIKTKLILVVSIFIVLLLGASAYLLINEKERELTEDIYINARNFSELTKDSIVDNYNLYLSQNSFVYFNREINNIFARNDDIASILMSNYNGEILYNSTEEQERQYSGELRQVENNETLLRIQAYYPSVKIKDSGRIVYLKKDEENVYHYVDQYEKPVDPITNVEKIDNIIVPYQGEFGILYGISYENLEKRIQDMTMRILLLTVFGILMGLLVFYIFSSKLTNPIEQLTESVNIIATGNFKYRVNVKSKDEIGKLATNVNKMAQDLEVSTKALVYKERVAKELELAAKIQKELLPKEVPKITGIDVSAGLIPAEEIGGDCYDFIKVGDKLISYIGDVTGHGVSSGIIVSIANAMVYSSATLPTLKDVVLNTNRVLVEKTSSNMFLTMLMLSYQENDNKISYVSCGHEEMYIYKAKEKKVYASKIGGMALGLFGDIEKTLEEKVIEMDKDDVLVLYSDGIPEAWANEKSMYGVGRFKRAISEFSDLPSAISIKNAILADVIHFIGDYKRMDDITLIVIKKT